MGEDKGSRPCVCRQTPLSVQLFFPDRESGHLLLSRTEISEGSCVKREKSSCSVGERGPGDDCTGFVSVVCGFPARHRVIFSTGIKAFPPPQGIRPFQPLHPTSRVTPGLHPALDQLQPRGFAAQDPSQGRPCCRCGSGPSPAPFPSSCPHPEPSPPVRHRRC